jgi:hypothetical protein
MEILNMKNKFMYPIILILVFFFGCEEESTPTEIGTNPSIEEITMRDKWNSASTILNKIEVKVTDPQGYSNLSGIYMEVKNQTNSQVVFSDSLYDDGAINHSQDGDVIAGDGIFSNRFSSVQILSGAGDGDYVFSFRSFDKENHESSLKEQTALFGPNTRPEIVNITGPDTLFSGTPGQIFEVAVFDSDDVEDVLRTYFETMNDSGQVIDISELFNDGDFSNHGDLFTNDSIFSIKLDSSFAADKLGLYRFNFHVEDSFNEENVIVPIHQIYIENKSGKVISTTVPDSLQRPVTPGSVTPFQLLAEVNDPQGLSDVQKVYFLSEKPDGTFSGDSTQFEMKDDGSQGDPVDRDGEYSIIIQIGDSNDLGTYIFHFFMLDKVGHLTDVVKDSIVVY